MNEEMDIITLTDENGVDVEFELLDVIEYEGADYVVLLPLPDDDSGEVEILKAEPIEGDDEMQNYVSVDDEDILNAVFNLFVAGLEEDAE